MSVGVLAVPVSECPLRLPCMFRDNSIGHAVRVRSKVSW